MLRKDGERGYFPRSTNEGKQSFEWQRGEGRGERRERERANGAEAGAGFSL